MKKNVPSSLSQSREQLSSAVGLERLRLIHSICTELLHSDPSAVSDLLAEASNLAREIEISGLADANVLRGECGETLRLRGLLAFHRASYAEAIHYLEAAETHFAESNHPEGSGNCWNNLAMVYHHLDDFGVALAYYQKALARARHTVNASAESSILGNIGILFSSMGELVEARRHIETALARAKTIRDTGQEVLWSSNLAEVYIALGRLEDARGLLERALHLSAESTDVALRIDVLRNLGLLRAREGDVCAAVAAYRKARSLAASFSARQILVELSIDLGGLVAPLPEAECVKLEVDPSATLEEALALAEEIDAVGPRARAHRALADFFERTADYQRAFAHLKRHSHLSRLVKAEENARKLRQQRLLFKVDQTRRELSVSRQANAEWEYEVERRMQMENQLRDALARARHADEVKTRFLATMSHEILTPMNGVLGMADILARTSLDPDQQEAVQVIQDSGGTLLRLIDDILDLAALEADRVQLREEEFSLADIVESVSEWGDRWTSAKGLSFRVHFPTALNRIYCGDAVRLQQILRILLSNAVKFTETGEVSVRFSDGEQGAGLRVVVEDTGIGIPADRMETIFEQFTQLDSSTTRQHSGAGLGLAIARKLVAMMGAQLSVESALDAGTRFTLEIPLTSRSAEMDTA